jgi:hypothetical protein
MVFAKCAYCGGEKNVPPSKYKETKKYFCNKECMGKYRVLHPMELPKKLRKINPGLQQQVTDLIREWFDEHGRPMYLSKKIMQGDVIGVYRTKEYKQYDDTYLRRVITGILIRDFEYDNPPGSLTIGNTLWREDGNK